MPAAGSNRAKEASMSNWGVYENLKQGFELKYPPEYETESSGTGLIFLSPAARRCVNSRGDADECKAVSPRVDYYFTDVYFNGLAFEDWVAAQKNDGAITPESRVEKIDVNGVTGYEVERSGTKGLERSVYFLRGDGFTINFSIPEEAPPEEIAAFNKILNTLRYTGQPRMGENDDAPSGAAGGQLFRSDEWGIEVTYPNAYTAETAASETVFLSPGARDCLAIGGEKDACTLASPRLGLYHQDEHFDSLAFEQWVTKEKQDGIMPKEATLHAITVAGQPAYEIGMNGMNGKKILNIFILRPDNRLINFRIIRDSKEIDVFDAIIDSVTFTK